jgi:GNAT superfamily N-acetyltransferase
MTAETLPVVGSDATPAIADLCSVAIAQPLSEAELTKALFANDQPAKVRFDPRIGVVATVSEGDSGSVRLIAVHPDSRRRGHGGALVRAAEADLEAAKVVTFGADPPYFLFPGVPTTEPWLCYLLERNHYAREETNYNVVVDLSRVPDGPGQSEIANGSGRGELDEWASQHWPNWRLELLRAFDQGGLALTRDKDGIASVCAFDVNRAATLGPVASRPDLIGTGAAKGLLLDALAAMRRAGYERIEVLWVGPLVPYARVGGTIGQTFFVYRKRRLFS